METYATAREFLESKGIPENVKAKIASYVEKDYEIELDI